MKTQSKFLVASFLMMVMFSQSCQKKYENASEEGLHSQVDLRSTCDPSNIYNPFDSAGIKHNLLVYSIISILDANDSISRVFQVSDSILINEFGSEVIPFLTDEDLTIEYLDELDRDFYKSAIVDLEIDSLQKAELLNLFATIDSLSEAGACAMIGAIRTIENDLILRYNPSEIEVYLIVSSIARYSIHFWDSKLERERAWNWRKIFVACIDVCGGIGGAMAGSATVVGAAATAVVSAVGASVGGDKLWDVFN